jgi:hypothetical protein
MNDLEKKDKILAFFNIEDNRDSFFQLSFLNELVFKESPLTDADLRYLVESIIDDGYITGNVYAFKFDASLTPFLEAGGYLGQDARKKKDEELQKVIDQKTINDGKLAKWQVKIFWPAFIFTLIGSALGIVSFIMQILLKSPVK